jgi:hypothetical protein
MLEEFEELDHLFMVPFFGCLIRMSISYGIYEEHPSVSKTISDEKIVS